MLFLNLFATDRLGLPEHSGILMIANDHTGDVFYANYDVRLKLASGELLKARVENFDRTLGGWLLIRDAISALEVEHKELLPDERAVTRSQGKKTRRSFAPGKTGAHPDANPIRGMQKGL